MGEVKKGNFSSPLEMDLARLDALPYGVTLVDEHGVILFYNRLEKGNINLASFLGKNFFTEVAPCIQIQEFYSQFLMSIHQIGLIADFRFHFHLRRLPRCADSHGELPAQGRTALFGYHRRYYRLNIMPLINCPDCKKEFSDQAKACPNCGRPFNVTYWTPARIILAIILGLIVLSFSIALGSGDLLK